MSKRKYPPGPEMEAIERLINKRDELQATVTRLRGLLRRIEETERTNGECPICGILDLNEEWETWIHADDCELAEAISK